MMNALCLNKKICMFGVSLLILTLFVAAVLGLLAGPGSPLTWLLIAALLVIPYVHRKLTARHYVEWKPEYSVGIDSIDKQHKKLLNLINQLQTAVDYSTGDQFEREALDELVPDYIAVLPVDSFDPAGSEPFRPDLARARRAAA